jgi:hypothetical protein
MRRVPPIAESPKARASPGVMPDWQLCSVNFLFFELNCEILCKKDLFLIVFRKLEVVRY